MFDTKLLFQGFEAPKEYIASQGKFYMNFIFYSMYMDMYVVGIYLLLDLKVLLMLFGKT